jgi:cytochrome c biogenesis protein CcmG/thiol:disulfide interchange protein DsbE
METAAKRRLRLPHWTTVLVIIIGIWSLPRLLPHVAAMFGVARAEEAYPRYATVTLDGNIVTQDSLRGKVVLVNVWATWCLPCKVEMPLLEGTWNRHRKEGLVVLGASVDHDGPEQVQEFVKSRGITYPIAIVNEAFIAAFHGVIGYPTSILIGRDGRVRYKVIGPIGPLTLEPEIRRALADTVDLSPSL